MAYRGSAGRGVKGVSEPPEHLLTCFHTILSVQFGGTNRLYHRFDPLTRRTPLHNRGKKAMPCSKTLLPRLLLLCSMLDEVTADTKWVMASTPNECDSACSAAGSTCDVAKFSQLTTEAGVTAAAAAAGVSCATYSAGAHGGSWDGPWILG